MSRKTLKVGKTGCYGPRYGSSLKHRALACMESQSKAYECASCGKTSLKRKAVGIWECKRFKCGYRVTGGAYTTRTEAYKTIYMNVTRAFKESKNN